MIVFGGPVSALIHGNATALHRSLSTNGPAGLASRWRLSSLGPSDAALGAVELTRRAYFAIPPLVQPSRQRSRWEAAS